MVSLTNYDPIEITTAICESLNFDCIIPTALYKSLQRREKNIIDAECLIEKQNAIPPALNESETEISHFFPPPPAKEEENFFRCSNGKDLQLFFLNVCNIFEESSLNDLTDILDSALKDKLKDLLDTYKPNKTENTNLKMKIIFKDDIPVCQRPRSLAFSEKIEVDKQIDEWLKEGIIRESTSEYSLPIVVRRKKKRWIDTNLCRFSSFEQENNKRSVSPSSYRRNIR